jgi:hypothetical protein
MSRMQKLGLRAGDWVEVKSKEEILLTLNNQAQLDGLPFMPQMFQYCGQRFRVYKSAHKTCDTVFPVRGRRLADAVHLETRCDGQAYGGCQAGCLIFWKEAWLKRADESAARLAKQEPAIGKATGEVEGCTEQNVLKSTRTAGQERESDPTYVCQATLLPYYTTDLKSYDLRQYLEDFTSGNETIGRMISIFCYVATNTLMNGGLGLGRPLRWLYDRFQGVRGGTPYPRRWGTIPQGEKTPSLDLDLQPGELVRVKPYKEILKTLDKSNRNRGLFFDAEMVPYCGKTYRVLKRVNQILDEKTGKMMRFKNPCIVLESVICNSCYSEKRFFCPRAIYSYWREIWLERVTSIPIAFPVTASKKPKSDENLTALAAG